MKSTLLNEDDFDLIVIGGGLSGGVCANLASKIRKNVLVIEKERLGGCVVRQAEAENFFFHTDNDFVARFFKSLGSYEPYELLSDAVGGKTHKSPYPFNFSTIEFLYEDQAPEIEKLLLEKFNHSSSINLLDLYYSGDKQLMTLCERLLKIVLEDNETKFYLMEFKDLSAIVNEGDVETIINIMREIPLRLSFDNHVFLNRYQIYPTDGYKKWFERLFSSDYIQVEYADNATERIHFNEKEKIVCYGNVKKGTPIVYTGYLDELFDYRYGKFIRINGQIAVVNKADRERRERYKKLASSYKNLFLCGSLAEAKFFCADDAIQNAMNVFSEIPLPVEISGRLGESIIESGNNFAKYEHIKSELVMGDMSRTVPDLTIVIPTYRRAKDLHKALLSALHQTVGIDKYDILIISNNTEDDSETRAVIKELWQPNLYYYRNAENLGAYGNMNRGISLSRSKWVSMLHDDDWLVPDAVQYIFEALDILDQDRLGAVLPRRIDVFENMPAPQGERITWKYKIRENAIQRTSERFWKITEFDYYMFPFLYPAPSYGTLINRDAFVEVGGMAEEYPCEDGFCMLKLARKYNCYLCGQAWGYYRFAQNGGFRSYDLLQSVQAVKNYRDYICSKNMAARIHNYLFGHAAYQLEVDGCMFWERFINGYNQCRQNYYYSKEFSTTPLNKKYARRAKRIWEVYTLMKGVFWGIETRPHKKLDYDPSKESLEQLLTNIKSTIHHKT